MRYFISLSLFALLCSLSHKASQMRIDRMTKRFVDVVVLIFYMFLCPCQRSRCGCCQYFSTSMYGNKKNYDRSYKWLTSFFIHDDMSCMKPRPLNIWSISQSIYHLNVHMNEPSVYADMILHGQIHMYWTVRFIAETHKKRI